MRSGWAWPEGRGCCERLTPGRLELNQSETPSPFVHPASAWPLLRAARAEDGDGEAGRGGVVCERALCGCGEVIDGAVCPASQVPDCDCSRQPPPDIDVGCKKATEESSSLLVIISVLALVVYYLS